MIDPASPPRSGRRVRVAGFLLAILVAFVVGGALAVYAARDGVGWFAPVVPGEPVVAPSSIAPSPVSPSSVAPSSVADVPAAAPALTAIDPATLQTRADTLAAQLASLEARTATVQADAAGAAGEAGRAEALLIAFASRRALDRGMGLGYLEEQLRRRFGATRPDAVLAVIAAAHRPVTLETLQAGLDASAQRLASGGDGWLDGVGGDLGRLVVLHSIATPSPLPRDRIARARRMLGVGDVAGALAEVEQLPGAGDAADWQAAARRYGASRHALDLLEGAALLGEARGAVPVAPAVPAASVPAPASIPAPAPAAPAA